MYWHSCAVTIRSWRRCSITGARIRLTKRTCFWTAARTHCTTPFIMNGMPQAVARIRAAIKNGEKIAVYGDFDADGVTSTALLTQALEALGGPCHRRIFPIVLTKVTG